MRIIVGNNLPVDSMETPVMLMLDSEDIEKIVSKPVDHDVVVFYPSHWPEGNGKKWARSKIDMINGRNKVETINSETVVSEVVTPPAPPSPTQPEPARAKAESSTNDVHGENDQERAETKLTDSDILDLLRQ